MCWGNLIPLVDGKKHESVDRLTIFEGKVYGHFRHFFIRANLFIAYYTCITASHSCILQKKWSLSTTALNALSIVHLEQMIKIED